MRPSKSSCRRSAPDGGCASAHPTPDSADQLFNRRDQLLRAFAVADGLLHDVLRFAANPRGAVSACSVTVSDGLVDSADSIGFHFQQTQTRNITNDFAFLCAVLCGLKSTSAQSGCVDCWLTQSITAWLLRPRELRLQHHRVVLLAQQILRLIEQARIRAGKR